MSVDLNKTEILTIIDLIDDAIADNLVNESYTGDFDGLINQDIARLEKIRQKLQS